MLKQRFSLYRPSRAGFTLIELVMIIVLLGILIAVSGYKGCTGCASDQPTEVAKRVAVDQVVADIQYAQMLAIASLNQRTIYLPPWFSNSYTIQDQAGGTIETRRLPYNITGGVFGGTVTFNSLGEKTGGTTNLTVGGNTITIYGVTGKVAS
jgi:hypothetical protein